MDLPQQVEVPLNNQSQRDDSRWAWLFRGLVVGALLIGTANALSFFFRSEGWGGLLGRMDPDDEAMTLH